MSVDVDVDERALREIYFPAYKAAIQEADGWTIDYQELQPAAGGFPEMPRRLRSITCRPAVISSGSTGVAVTSTAQPRGAEGSARIIRTPDPSPVQAGRSPPPRKA